MCNQLKKDADLEYLVTKEYYVQDYEPTPPSSTETTNSIRPVNKNKKKKKKRKKQKKKTRQPQVSADTYKNNDAILMENRLRKLRELSTIYAGNANTKINKRNNRVMDFNSEEFDFYNKPFYSEPPANTQLHKNNFNEEILIGAKNKNKHNQVVQVQSSEERYPSVDSKTTPNIKEAILIEDRLDHLEKVLPHYSRKKAYKTSTLTVTKTKFRNGPTATLLVHNCVPEGVEICPSGVQNKYKSSSVKYTKIPTLHGWLKLQKYA